MRDAINAALKQAMRDQDKRRVSTLRLVNAAIKDRDIAARGEGREALNDAAILDLLGKMIRQRQDSAGAYEAGNRPELAAAEREEIEIIRAFMPEQLDDAALRAACAEAIRASGATNLRDMGKAMQALKERYQGRVDLGQASAIVKGMLG